MSDLVDLMTLKKELNRAHKSREEIDNTIADLKKKIKNYDKRFYIGEKFICNNTVYQLIKHGVKVALVIVDNSRRNGTGVGWSTKAGWHKIPIDRVGYNKPFIRNLPTKCPEDFGLDGKYGWYE